jgi:hypothetical protein
MFIRFAGRNSGRPCRNQILLAVVARERSSPRKGPCRPRCSAAGYTRFSLEACAGRTLLRAGYLEDQALDRGAVWQFGWVPERTESAACAPMRLLSKECCQVALPEGSGSGAYLSRLVLGLRKWMMVRKPAPKNLLNRVASGRRPLTFQEAPHEDVALPPVAGPAGNLTLPRRGAVGGGAGRVDPRGRGRADRDVRRGRDKPSRCPYRQRSGRTEIPPVPGWMTPPRLDRAGGIKDAGRSALRGPLPEAASRS